MPPKPTKLRTILNKLDVIKDKTENSTLLNLTKKPPVEPKDQMPHIKAGKANVIDQADLLHMPNDGGYKYILVVVDDHSKKWKQRN